MAREPVRMNLYPDLNEFYREGVVETGSSIDLPIYGVHGLEPSAPPPSDLDPDELFEPEEDYMWDLEPDYDDADADYVDVSENLNNLNLNASEKKILHDKNIEVPTAPRDTKDFRAWMTWRLQANKLLAAVILIRKGHQVHLRRSEIRRKPLTRQNVQTIVQEAKGGLNTPRDRAERTSLPGCPYIMYGIPRVKINKMSASTTNR